MSNAVVIGSLAQVAKANNQDLKQCSKCFVERPLDQFPKSKQKKDGHSSWCLECGRIYSKQYLSNPINRQKVAEKGSQWYAENKERRLQADREWSITHRKSRRRYTRNWAATHQAEIQEKNKKYYAEHREQAIAYMKKYQKENPKKFAQYWAKRVEAIKANTVGNVDYSRILERDQSICHICKLVVEKAQLSFDHVIPLSKGGPHSEDNIKVAHRKCNASKGKKILTESVTT